MPSLYQNIALIGYFGVLALTLLWNTLIAPSTNYPVALVLIVLVGPLLFALRGLLHGKRYTYAWVSMLILPYFIMGISDAYADPVDKWYGYLMILFSCILFFGSIAFIRSARKNRQQDETNSLKN